MINKLFKYYSSLFSFFDTTMFICNLKSLHNGEDGLQRYNKFVKKQNSDDIY